MRNIRHIPLVLASLALLAGCGGDSNNDSDQPTTPGTETPDNGANPGNPDVDPLPGNENPGQPTPVLPGAQGSTCDTLDYGAVAPASEYYRVFASDRAASAFVQSLFDAGAFAPVLGADATFGGISPDARLHRLVDEVMEGYRKVFPKEMTGITGSPHIAIVNVAIPNAFALGPMKSPDQPDAPAQSPFIFFVTSDLLEKGGSDAALRGLFAHEIGHLVLRTFLPEIQARVRAAYLLGGSEDGILGAAQSDDPAVAAHIESMMKVQERIGGIPEIGTQVFLGTYAKIFGGFMQGQETPTAACTEAMASAQAMAQFQVGFLPGYPAGDLSPRTPTAEEQAQLTSITDAFEAKLRACAGAEKAPLALLVAVINNLSPTAAVPGDADHEKFLQVILPEEVQVDRENPNASLVDRMLLASKLMRTRLLSIRANPTFPIDKLRVYDFEEDADDASIRVLHARGDDATGVGRFMLSLMPESLRNACLDSVEAGNPVSYGRLVDVHPTHCWRYYHATQFAASLNVCEEKSVRREVSPRQGSGKASVYDQMLRDSMNQGYGPRSMPFSQ